MDWDWAMGASISRARVIVRAWCDFTFDEKTLGIIKVMDTPFP